MKRIIIVIAFALAVCGIGGNVFAKEIQPRANYETLNKTTYERFHLVNSDQDNFYGNIRFYSTVNVNIHTGLCTLAGNSATPNPSNGSKLSASFKRSGYLKNDSKFYVQWNYTAKKLDASIIRTGTHEQSY